MTRTDNARIPSVDRETFRQVVKAYVAADYITSQGHGYISGADDEWIERQKQIMQAFAGINDDVDEALSILQRIEEDRHARMVARASRADKRREIARRYNDLFVTVGRRDGFKCAACHATENLQLDHIVPVALDGSNDLDNLQILCGHCNSSKSDTTADYRS